MLTHSLHYGSAVFEGVRAYAGKAFLLREHLERLARSAELVGYSLPFDAPQLTRGVLAVLEANRVQDGYIRPIAWRGAGSMGIPSKGARIQVAIATWSWPHVFDPEAHERGIRLTVSSYRRGSANVQLAQSKCAANYVIGTLARDAAAAAGFDDALLLDTDGRVTEATGANLFLVRDGKLITPPPTNFLDGITRRFVIQLARKLGIEVLTTPLETSDLAHAEEAFLTGTAYEIQPIRSIHEITFSVGSLTRALRERFAQAIADPTSAALGAG